ncbi:uncharacterized protein PITG_17819 [Phytophthora infestans T30-4]|uniref:Uncharacterized protein n=1 Tax=Phytophthora infestans (strain T30-4) TaxID=403677 RepID=D0NW52_PHYIT|nr:uncharacterized protein PITG_17819 [Phytophthora infestans T30-4]EEY66937.1 hypothetical protein PITG_17819 [Phytophthora infestans T30-4]|eukprot:XP_002896655.1 hypothetical protein PITG_17819 [Phytophthora infestans T30-4]
MAEEDNEHSAKLHRLVFACDVLEVECLLLVGEDLAVPLQTVPHLRQGAGGNRSVARMGCMSGTCRARAIPSEVWKDIRLRGATSGANDASGIIVQHVLPAHPDESSGRVRRSGEGRSAEILPCWEHAGFKSTLLEIARRVDEHEGRARADEKSGVGETEGVSPSAPGKIKMRLTKRSASHASEERSRDVESEPHMSVVLRSRKDDAASSTVAVTLDSRSSKATAGNDASVVRYE